MVLYGTNRRQWDSILPRMNPVCRWIDDDGKVLIRWEMPQEVADEFGVDVNTGCATPGCGCSDMLAYDGGLFIDTNWRQTNWFFDVE
jgi:hypothetical protein